MKNYSRLVFLILVSLCISFSPSVFAASFYISPIGNDNAGDGSYGSPWKTFSYSFSQMSGGDELVLRDGNYTYSENGRINNPPSGSAGGYTIIRAENNWQALFTGYSGSNVPVELSSVSYIQLDGLKFKDIDCSHSILVANSSFIKIFRVAVKNGGSVDGRWANVICFSNSHHCLLEDSWVVGLMRYGVQVTESYSIILRRVVVRFDGNSEREPKAGFCFYGATGSITGVYDCEIQNCIAIDYNSGEALGGGFINTHSAKGIIYRGCLAINIPSNGYLINEDADSERNEVYNSIAWDCNGHAFAFSYSNPSSYTNLDQITSGENSRDMLSCWRSYPSQTHAPSITNSMFYNNGEQYNGTFSFNYNIYFGNAGSIPTITQDPNRSIADPSFQYLIRSPDSGTGDGGKVRGATIEKRVGVSGTLYGEPGYNITTTEDLWPYPHEEQIRDNFREADSFSWYTQMWDGDSSVPSSNNTERGFCADGQTLTKYIWEYLGNTMPADIYGPDTTAPAAVSNLAAVSGSNDGEVDLTWTATGDDGASGTANSYDLRYSENQITENSWQTTEVATNEPSPSAAGSSEAMTISGLTTGQTYYFAIKSQDEVLNISALSNVASAQAKETIVVSDTTPPYTTGHNPADGATSIARDSNIIIHVKDDGAGVDITTIVMKVNGVTVSPDITGDPDDYILTYDPPADFNYGSTVAISVEAQDLAP